VILDIVVKTTNDVIIAIEVQNKYISGMEKRLKCYTNILAFTLLKK
jgi:hypothetical protein